MGSGRGISLFERYLTLWVMGCITAGMVLGRTFPQIAGFLDGLAIKVGDAPVVSVPIAVCLFLMMYPAIFRGLHCKKSIIMQKRAKKPGFPGKVDNMTEKVGSGEIR